MKIGIATSNPNFMGIIEKELAGHHEVVKMVYTNDMATNAFQIGRMVDNVDCIFVDFVQTPLDILINLKLNKPIIARMHRIEMYNYANSNPWSQLPLKGVDLIFSCDHVRDRFHDYIKALPNGPDLEPRREATILSNMVDTKFFKPMDVPEREEKRMCIVGHVIPKKRVFDLISAMPLLDGWTLDIAGEAIRGGNGLNEYLINCYDLIETLGLKGRVNILGKIPHESLPQFYSNHDVIVSNSNEEGTHVAVAEAMACGCYPVVFNWRGANDIYGITVDSLPNANIFANHDDLYRVLEDWVEVAPSRESVRAEAILRFDSKKIAPKVREFIEGSVSN